MDHRHKRTGRDLVLLDACDEIEHLKIRLAALKQENAYARAFLTPIAGPWITYGGRAFRYEASPGHRLLACAWTEDEKGLRDAALRAAGWFLRDADEEG